MNHPRHTSHTKNCHCEECGAPICACLTLCDKCALSQAKEQVADYCTFAWPGTYGHECGKPAVKVGVKQSKYTRDGIYYAGRCEDCSHIAGFENTGLQFEPFNPAVHINRW